MTRNVVQEYQDHLVALAIKIHCELRQATGLHGMMYVEFGYIEGPVVTCQRDYLVNLHELGHFACGHTQGRPPHTNKRFYFDNGVLHSEAEAWEWALDNAIDELTPETRKFCWDDCLGTYYHSACLLKGRPYRLTNGNRHHVQFVFDKPDAYFFKVAQRLRGRLNIYTKELHHAGTTS